jgi:hypothetical protein
MNNESETLLEFTSPSTLHVSCEHYDTEDAHKVQ